MGVMDHLDTKLVRQDTINKETRSWDEQCDLPRCAFCMYFQACFSQFSTNSSYNKTQQPNNNTVSKILSFFFFFFIQTLMRGYARGGWGSLVLSQVQNEAGRTLSCVWQDHNPETVSGTQTCAWTPGCTLVCAPHTQTLPHTQSLSRRIHAQVGNSPDS